MPLLLGDCVVPLTAIPLRAIKAEGLSARQMLNAAGRRGLRVFHTFMNETFFN